MLEEIKAESDGLVMWYNPPQLSDVNNFNTESYYISTIYNPDTSVVIGCVSSYSEDSFTLSIDNPIKKYRYLGISSIAYENNY